MNLVSPDCGYAASRPAKTCTSSQASIRARKLARLDHIARLLDSRFSVFGVRFGFDSIIGFFPIAGDFIMAGFSVWLITEAVSLGARKRTLLRMALNTLIDTLIGAIPLFGSVFDIFFRSNNRNIRLLQKEMLNGH